MCPLCHSMKVRRSHRQPLDFLLLVLRAKPMRCRTCSYRFYQWPWSGLAATAPPPPAPELQKQSAAAASSGKH